MTNLNKQKAIIIFQRFFASDLFNLIQMRTSMNETVTNSQEALDSWYSNVNENKIDLLKELTIQICDDFWLRKCPRFAEVIGAEACQIFGVVIVWTIYGANRSIRMPKVKRYNVSLDQLRMPHNQHQYK